MYQTNFLNFRCHTDNIQIHFRVSDPLLPMVDFLWNSWNTPITYCHFRFTDQLLGDGWFLIFNFLHFLHTSCPCHLAAITPTKQASLKITVTLCKKIKVQTPYFLNRFFSSWNNSNNNALVLIGRFFQADFSHPEALL